MIRFLFLGWIVIVIACVSCNENQANQAKIEVNTAEKVDLSDEYKIINSTFCHLLTPGPTDSKRVFGYDNFISKKPIPLEYFKKISFVNTLVAFGDTGFFNVNRDVRNFNDSTFNLLYDILKVDVKDDLKLNLDSVKNVGLWQLIPVEKGQDIDLEIGKKLITYSRIVFNDTKTKGAFYFQDRCAGLCGKGEIVFVEKINGIWTIVDEVFLWVS